VKTKGFEQHATFRDKYQSLDREVLKFIFREINKEIKVQYICIETTNNKQYIAQFVHKMHTEMQACRAGILILTSEFHPQRSPLKLMKKFFSNPDFSKSYSTPNHKLLSSPARSNIPLSFALPSLPHRPVRYLQSTFSRIMEYNPDECVSRFAQQKRESACHWASFHCSFFSGSFVFQRLIYDQSSLYYFTGFSTYI
jgi:hypothetical protein